MTYLFIMTISIITVIVFLAIKQNRQLPPIKRQYSITDSGLERVKSRLGGSGWYMEDAA